MTSDGSPVRRSNANRGYSEEDGFYEDDKTPMPKESYSSLKTSSTVLTSSKLANQAAPKKAKVSHNGMLSEVELNPMDKLLAALSEQKTNLARQNEKQRTSSDAVCTGHGYVSRPITSPGSVSPSLGPFGLTASPTSFENDSDDDEIRTQPDEVILLKVELEKAKLEMARMNQELNQSRITKQIVEQAAVVPSESDFSLTNSVNSGNTGLPNLNQGRPYFVRDNAWNQDDTRSDCGETPSAGGQTRSRGPWADSNGRFPYQSFQSNMPSAPEFQQNNMTNYPPQAWMARPLNDRSQFNSGSASNSPVPFFKPDSDLLMPGGDRRTGSSQFGNRRQLDYNGSGSFDSVLQPLGYGSGGGTGFMGGGLGLPSPIGTPLSPYAPEFTADGAATWKAENTANEGQTFVPTTEPLNYRRMLDRNVSCDWRYIVDKIVCSNDQQASIFLQQKLKVGTAEHKYEIVESIVSQAYPLMVNRFGNFLVQRCFEHGTPEQVIKIAQAIRGNTLNLSMDAFGCHVVQKAFDSVPEDYKAIMVHELLRRIPETVIHRYACHVWQKLFELRWTASPPQIMKYVNDALRGMWHEVALGETGSLVVQNIFENCLEEDKRPCIEEVLASINIVAHGQFGNWCIQHICEHGAPADRSRAIDHVIRYATEYSTDQFASKVVEKCLKIGGAEFLGRYLDRVCEGRMDRPRIPLIDIASDQYGNYLVQYILTHSNQQHRDAVAAHIRKHMVSLRGSKFGSRVGMLCTNPAITTRPGPSNGPGIVNRLPPQNSQQPRYNGGYGR